MKKIFLVIVILLFSLIEIPIRAEEQPKDKEHIYSQLTRAIIRLEHFNKLKGENESIGTAFFVRSGNDLFVVTARHVAQQDYDLHARVKCENIKTGEMEVILLELSRDRWVYHPEQGDKDTRYVDVAAMKIAQAKDRQIKTFRYESVESGESEKTQFPFEDPKPPEAVLVFGFPYEIGFDLLEQKPFGRLGIVAMDVGEKFLKLEDKFVEPKACLIDVEAFPGNSGSPVINQFTIDSKIKLLGLLIAVNTNMDFAVIEPASRIRETLEIAKKQSVENLDFWFILMKNWPYSTGREGKSIAYILNALFFPNADFLSGSEKYFVYQVFKNGGQADMNLIDEISDKFQEAGYRSGTMALEMFHRLRQMNIVKEAPVDKIIFEEPYLTRALNFSRFDSLEKFREYVRENYQKKLRKKLLEEKSTSTQSN